MKIIISMPAISYDMASSLDSLNGLGYVSRFEPSGHTLDIFHQELKDVQVDGFFGLNVPHWPLAQKGSRGVAGPGLPVDELFCPVSLQQKLQPLAGKYDKWRPYPATAPLSNYSRDIARRYARKRCKMFVKIAQDYKWDCLFYAEHAPASLAHLDGKLALDMAREVVDKALSVYAAMPYIQMLIFSPYGPKKQDAGFCSCNLITNSSLYTWANIKEWLYNESSGY